MELTESWRDVFPAAITDRYEISETRNAAKILHATSPEAFRHIVDVLSNFQLTVDKVSTPGGQKTVIAQELDESFRVLGWREAQYNQILETNLTFFRWTNALEVEETRVTTHRNEYGGHKIDNVLGRAALDVEWNPKDGNLDRDLSNYTALHDAGAIDVGVIVTRIGPGLRELIRDTIFRVKATPVLDSPLWSLRMKKLANDPLGTSTTSNMGKLVPRLKRGDGRGCPILAIAITERCFVWPQDSIMEETRRLAAKVAEVNAAPEEPVAEAVDDNLAST